MKKSKVLYVYDPVSIYRENNGLGGVGLGAWVMLYSLIVVCASRESVDCGRDSCRVDCAVCPWSWPRPAEPARSARLVPRACVLLCPFELHRVEC